MNTLDDAWDWFRSTRNQVRLMQRLAFRYWDDLPWIAVLSQDRFFRDLNKSLVSKQSALSLKYLDDLAIVVQFSVFEAEVREQVLKKMEPEVAGLKHPALIKAAAQATEQIQEGSFFRVLEPFKTFDAALVEEVN